MKYIIMLGDGMADEPLAELEGKTPLECANTPTLDVLAKKSEIGMAHTIPEGMSPGSDTANLAVLGYNPRIYYTGRSPLEALSIGVDMKDTDIAIRCNIVTVSEEEGIAYEERTIIDHSSDEISTEDAAVLLKAVQEALENDIYKFYVGTSYRHLLIWDGGTVVDLEPPHDHLGCVIKDYLPKDEVLRRMMEKSYDILENHPINEERRAKGLKPANSCWFWGAGTRPALTSFEEKTKLKGSMISAVDLLKGIAVGAGMKNIEVEGANGGLHTNYEGKAQAAADTLLVDGQDFVYIHLEGPDEMGHQGSIERKIQAIENMDARLIKPLVERMDASGEAYRLLVMPDHPTPIRIRTHSSNPVPFMIYDNRKDLKKDWSYNEKDASASGNIVIEEGYQLLDRLIGE